MILRSGFPLQPQWSAFYVFIRHAKATLSALKSSDWSQNCRSRNTLTCSVTIAAASTPLQESFVFSTMESFVIPANWTPTHPTHLSTTFERSPSRHSFSCCRAGIVKSTASYLILLGEPSAPRLLDGPV